jgi:hypothetical protein
MAAFNGTETVVGGYYLNGREWKFEMVDGPSGVLPGDETVQYRRIPVPAMLVLAPLMGLVFVMVVPFIGLAVIGEQLWKKARALAVDPGDVSVPRH